MKQKLIMENWRKFVRESSIAEEERLLEGWLQKALAGGALTLGMMGNPSTAQAEPSGEETSQQEQSIEYNPFHVLLGMLDMYIDGSPLQDKATVNMKWSKVLSALSAASGGDTSALDGLTGNDLGMLKVIEKHVEKNSGDQELVKYWGEHGTTINVQLNTNY
tara:strand:+ start:926 stop:1411 length:486 start_codon:yes stop_codon:yes gene_type:complete